MLELLKIRAFVANKFFGVDSKIEFKIYPNFIHGLLLTVCLIILYVIFYVLMSIPLYAKVKLPNFYIPLVFAISSFLFIPVIFYTLKKSKVNIFEEVRFPALIVFIILVIIAVSLNIVSMLLYNPVAYFRSFFEGQVTLLNFKPFELNPVFIITFIHAVILAPVFEEVFFRGILLKQFLKKYSPILAIVLSTLLFTLGHIDIHVHVASLLVCGFTYGYIYYKTQSLVAAIFVHAIDNLIGSLTKVYVTPVSDSSLRDLFFIIAIGIVGIYLCVKHLDKYTIKHS